MHILELDSYNLSDTVKFHDRLNPRLWDSAEHLRPDVASKLMEIARDFQEFMGVPDLDVVDITISGSNAAYNYTDSSDIDLHLVINIPKVAHDEVYRELFNAKKYEYNDIHNIRIGGADVELYAQDSEQPHHSQGIYSLLKQDWISVPRRRRSTIDDVSTRSKYEDLAARVDSTIKTQDRERMVSLMDKIKIMRRTGLEKEGEFGSDNLAFKLLRNNGYIKRLIDARNAARDAELSLAELAKPRQTVRYGFTTESPDGVNPTTKMFLENEPADQETTVQEFIAHVIDRLGIDPVPEIVLHSDSAWSKQNQSFGRYNADTHALEVNLADRHIMDILRTVAHELVHCHQNQQRPLPDHAGRTGSPWENDANARAGVIMRDYAESNPEKFTESASGYIPRNKKEARDPRFSMALTQDIGPGQVGREANKLGLKTDANGKPALLMKSANALRESKNNLSEIDRRGVLKAIGAGAAAAAVPGVAQAGPFVDVAALGKSNPEQAQKVWTPRYRELTARCQVLLRQLIAAAGSKWAPLLKGTTIRVVSSDNYAQASAISRMIAIDLSVFWDAPDAALAFTIAHELGHIALEHGVGTDDESADYKTQLRVAAQYRQDELNADEFAVRICKVLGYNKAEVFKFIAQNEAELKLFDLLTQSPTSTHPSQKTRIERARMNGFQLSRGGIEQMNVLKQHLAEHDTVHSDLVENLQQEFALFEEQDLFEINMGSKNLRREAAKTGANAGMEFEMIVPDVPTTSSDSDDYSELEPNWDIDERASGPYDIRNFFTDRDHNTPGDVDRLIDNMMEDYTEWQSEEFGNRWDSDSEEFIYDYIKDNVDDDEIRQLLDMESEDPIGRTEYQLASEKIAADQLEPYYEDAENDARDIFFNEDMFEDWLEDSGLETMQRIYERYDNRIQWPHWYDSNSGNSSDSPDTQSIADSFSAAVGRPAYARSSYHQYGQKRPGYDDFYVVEPDGSLEPNNYQIVGQDGETYKLLWSEEPLVPDKKDDEGLRKKISDQAKKTLDQWQSRASQQPDYVNQNYRIAKYNGNETPLEFVSPYMPIDKMLAELNKVVAWAKANKCTTNYKTGLHINISVPNYNQDRLDYVKLALLMGDEYVLEQFGRTGNKYAASALGKVRDRVKARPYEAKYLLDKMKGHMRELASQAIHSSNTDKFTSINTKEKQVEFRSPGGDWLDENLDKIENTLLRFTVALSAAMDPKAYREEYLKKLYKVLNPQNLQDTYGEMIQEFANYMAALQKDGDDTGGVLSKETQQAVKSFRQAAAQELKQKNIDKKLKKSGEDIVNGHRWRVSLKPELGGGVVEVTATDSVDAKKQAIQQQPNWRFVDDSALTVTRLDEPAAGASTTGPHPEGRGRPNDPTGRLAIVNRDDPLVFAYSSGTPSAAPDYLFRFTLPDGYSQAQLRSVLAAWAARENANAADYMIVDTTQFAAPEQTAAPESGSVQWNIINRNNETVHTFWNRNVQADANTAAHQWLHANYELPLVDGQGPFDVIPAAIPGSTQDLQRQRQAADSAANTRRWADYEASQSRPTPVPGVEDIDIDIPMAQPAKAGTNIHRIAQEEGRLLWADEQIVNELKINNATGVGAVPYNREIDYHGLRVTMRPSMFLRLALPLDQNDPEERKAIEYCKSQLDDQGIGAPFLTITVPAAWESDDFSLEAKVRDHDGRHRCYAILDKEGDKPIEVHLLMSGGLRRRHISDLMIKNLRNGILNQQGQYVSGPIFDTAQ